MNDAIKNAITKYIEKHELINDSNKFRDFCVG